MSKLDFHPSFRESASLDDLAASLRAGKMDQKLLYASARQTELWREVFLHHSPIHHNPEFARIYRDAFQKMADALSAKSVWLIGLGAGTGLKEAELISQLKDRGREVLFSAIDVSSHLVLEASGKAIKHGANLGNSLVGDLADTGFLKQWLADCGVVAPRLFTFFGLVPNLAPAMVERIFHAVLRPGDILLCSVHLAPVSEEVNLPEAMSQVLPQYNNAESLAWLKAGLDEWGLSDRFEEPRMIISESMGIPAFLGLARRKSDEPEMDAPLQVFQSLRYTPALFEDLLKGQGFVVERLAMTACREEGIWCIHL